MTGYLLTSGENNHIEGCYTYTLGTTAFSTRGIVRYNVYLSKQSHPVEHRLPNIIPEKLGCAKLFRVPGVNTQGFA